jgi:ribosomal protein L7/L12
MAKKSTTKKKVKATRKTARSKTASRGAKKDDVTVVLISYGTEKIKTLIPFRRFTNLGLTEAKNFVEGELPAPIPRLEYRWDRKEAEEFVAELKKAGASAKLGPAAKSVSVTLHSIGEERIETIELVREFTGLGIEESEEIVDGVLRGWSFFAKWPRSTAEKFKARLEKLGGGVNVGRNLIPEDMPK